MAWRGRRGSLGVLVVRVDRDDGSLVGDAVSVRVLPNAVRAAAVEVPNPVLHWEARRGVRQTIDGVGTEVAGLILGRAGRPQVGRARSSSSLSLYGAGRDGTERGLAIGTANGTAR